MLHSTGAGLIGLTTYGLVEDYRAARELIAFIPKNASEWLGVGARRALPTTNALHGSASASRFR